ncbi:hypothetical protein [[Pantoea] beijingensis]|nr:hypothetical protein [[Pantoea] beijingensis]
MKTLRAITLSAITVATMVSSAGFAYANKVTPYYDGSNQIRTLLDSDVIAQALGNQMIETMDYKGFREDMARMWKIDTENCTIRVALVVDAHPQSAQKGIVYKVEEPVKNCK